MLRPLSALLVLPLLLGGCATTRMGRWTEVPGTAASGPGRFTVLTLNTAHGARQPALSFLANRRHVEQNLARLARTLAREQADVVALQEVHRGSGEGKRGVDQLGALMEGSGYGHHFFGVHREGRNGDAARGTALLSESALSAPDSRSFGHHPDGDHGWVVATVHPEGLGGEAVDVVSVHLDAFSMATRRRQMDDLARAFQNRSRPLVVMGDFNADWAGRDGVQHLARRLGLSAFSPRNGERTFPSVLPVARVDWILVSSELRILRHRTFRDPATDHCGVVAELGFSPVEWARRQGRQAREAVARARAAADGAGQVAEAGGATGTVVQEPASATVEAGASAAERGRTIVEAGAIAAEPGSTIVEAGGITAPQAGAAVGVGAAPASGRAALPAIRAN